MASDNSLHLNFIFVKVKMHKIGQFAEIRWKMNDAIPTEIELRDVP